MKHATARALEPLAVLVAYLRGRRELRERTPGVFYRGRSAFLHFHEDTAGVFADVRTLDGWKRLPVASPAQQEGLTDLVAQLLSAVSNAVSPARRPASARLNGAAAPANSPRPAASRPTARKSPRDHQTVARRADRGIRH